MSESVVSPRPMLPAGLETKVQEVFAQAGQGLRLRQAKISGSGIDAVVCEGAERCARLTLRAAQPCEDGAAAGPFCARWPDGAPSFANRVQEVWAQQPTGEYWQAPPDAPMTAQIPRPVIPHLSWLPALPTTLVPLLVGYALWRGAHRLRAWLPAPPWLTAWGVLVLFTLGWELGPMPIGLWEAIWALTLASLGIAFARAGAARAALIGLGIAVGLSASEAAMRLLPAATRPDHPQWFTQLPWDVIDVQSADNLGRTVHWQNYACSNMAASAARAVLAESGGGRPVTLHLGDSLVHGLTVPKEQTLAHRLAALDPDWHHVRGAMPGTSIDAALVLLRNWGPILRPKRVVLYIYTGNDLDEIGAKYPCCGSAPLLDWSQAGLPSLCPEPRRPSRLDEARTNLVWRSLPPYLWRLLASHSALAAQLGRGLVSLAHGSGTLWRESRLVRVAHFRAALDALAKEARRQGASLLITIAPNVEAERGVGEHERDLHIMRSLLQERGYAYWDGHEAFAAEWRRLGTDAYMLTSNVGDMHLNAEGHALWAALLAPVLRQQAQ